MKQRDTRKAIAELVALLVDGDERLAKWPIVRRLLDEEAVQRFIAENKSVKLDA